MLLFESHPPDHEAGSLPGILALLEKLFEVEEVDVLDYGTLLDHGRTFLVAKSRA
jgi:hypothetical protein